MYYSSLNAQITGDGYPEIEWRSIDHAATKASGTNVVDPSPGQSQTQQESSTEWWYDVTVAKENGRQVGYYASGFATYNNIVFDETNSSGCYTRVTQH